MGEAAGKELLDCYHLINAASLVSTSGGLTEARSLTNNHSVDQAASFWLKEKHRALWVIEQQLCTQINRIQSVTKHPLWHNGHSLMWEAKRA